MTTVTTRTDGPARRTRGGAPRGGGRGTPTAPAHWWRRAALPVAAVWSAATTALATGWLAEVPGLPGNPAAVDDSPHLAVHGALGAEGTAWLLLALGATGLVLTAAAVVQRSRARSGAAPGPVGRGAVVVGMVALGVVLAVVLPDFRVLATIGYLPVLAVAWILGALPDGVTLLVRPDLDMLLWAVVGIFLVVAGFDHRRRLTGDLEPHGLLGRRAVARWAPWAVGVAVAVPVGYAVTRVAWALGIPLGVRPELLDELGDAVYVGAGLAMFAVAGAVLTLGLVQRWGEVFPRWLPGLRGRTVPVGLAVVPASFVSALVASAGLMFTRLMVDVGLGEAFPGEPEDVAAWLPELFWPLWGAALLAATYAYQLRRTPVRD